MDVDELLAEMDAAIDGKSNAHASRVGSTTHNSSSTSRFSSTAAAKTEEEHKSQPAAAAKASAVQRVTVAAGGSGYAAASRVSKQPVDDLDSLLNSMDELISAPSAAHTSSTSATRQPAAIASSATANNRTPTTASMRTAPPAHSTATSCTPLVLSSASPSSPPPCPRLLCLSCDHRVLSVPHWLFASEADYIFLRTTVPDVTKLRERMYRSEGGMGWCCQCMYVNVESGSTVRVDGGRAGGGKCRWICTGHNNGK